MDDHKFPVNAETMNAIVTGIGAVVFALTRQLSPEQQKSFQTDLLALSRARNRVGDTTAGTMILDLAAASEVAARPD